jgi:hypothetical protein
MKPITHGMNPDLEEVEDAANPRRQRCCQNLWKDRRRSILGFFEALILLEFHTGINS